MSKRLMVWATCCNKGNLKYYDRCVEWYYNVQPTNYLIDSKGQPFSVSFYVFNDGKRLEHWLPQKVSLIPHEELGRKSGAVFPGWKRSFHEAMKISLDYDYCLHVENDVLVQDWTKFFAPILCHSDNWMVAFDEHYSWPETAVMWLGDRKLREHLAEVTKDSDFWFSDQVFEIQIRDMGPVIIPTEWTSYRREGLFMDDPVLRGKTFIAQMCGDWKSEP